MLKERIEPNSLLVIVRWHDLKKDIYCQSTFLSYNDMNSFFNSYNPMSIDIINVFDDYDDDFITEVNYR